MFKSIRLIMQEMDKVNMHYNVEDMEDVNILSAGYGIENGPTITIKVFSQDDDNDVAVRVYGILHNVAEERIPKIMKVINQCNQKFRYFKFVMNDDNDVSVEYDFPVEASDYTLGQEVVEILMRMMHVLDECYPVLMRAIWS